MSSAPRKASRKDRAHRLLKKAIEVSEHRHLWHPDDGINFIPQVCSTVFGDGRALLELTTINSRPRYYVIRIDSSWNIEDHYAPDGAPDLRDHLDDIYEALGEQFGRTSEEDLDDDGEPCELQPWPAFRDDIGTSWCRTDWPKIRRLRFTKHPFTPFNILGRT